MEGSRILREYHISPGRIEGRGRRGVPETGKEGDVFKYPTPDELWNMTFAKQNRWRDYFSAIPFEDRGGYFQGRYYQDISVKRVLEAIAAGNLRILLTLATGTGKKENQTSVRDVGEVMLLAWL